MNQHLIIPVQNTCQQQFLLLAYLEYDLSLPYKRMADGANAKFFLGYVAALLCCFSQHAFMDIKITEHTNQECFVLISISRALLRVCHLIQLDNKLMMKINFFYGLAYIKLRIESNQKVSSNI